VTRVVDREACVLEHPYPKWPPGSAALVAVEERSIGDEAWMLYVLHNVDRRTHYEVDRRTHLYGAYGKGWISR
jgi:hypothetical protein